MAKQFDVYRDWLGVTDTNRPLNYYQVLRLPKFEDDASKIRAHFHKMNSHVPQVRGAARRGRDRPRHSR